MAYVDRLVDYLLSEAAWRHKVAERHDDAGSYYTARGYEEAAAGIRNLPDTHPWIAALTEARWLTLEGFALPAGPASEYVRRYRRAGAVDPERTWEDFLFTLAIHAGGDEVWRSYANGLRGRAKRFDLLLVPCRPSDTGRPQWESYSLQTVFEITKVGCTSLLSLNRYISARETARESRPGGDPQ